MSREDREDTEEPCCQVRIGENLVKGGLLPLYLIGRLPVYYETSFGVFSIGVFSGRKYRRNKIDFYWRDIVGLCHSTAQHPLRLKAIDNFITVQMMG